MSTSTRTAHRLSAKHRTASPRRQAPPTPRSDPRVAQTRYVGLDVHGATITAAVAEPDGTVHVHGTIPHTPDALRALVKKLTAHGHTLAVCYEAGATGYGVYRQLTALGIACTVVAPSLIPKAPGARVKTDTRDAIQLARLHRLGDLVAVWVPDVGHEALRDLVRAREGALYDRTRARHRVSKLLLRYSIRRPEGLTAWTTRHRTWLTAHVTKAACFASETAQVTLAEYVHELDHHTDRLARYDAAITQAVATAPPMLREVIHALQALRGVSLLTATTVVAELGQLSRFARPRQLMSYAGIVPREYSSGTTIRRGGITKHGNAHLRRIIVEAAWAYRFPAKRTPALQRRLAGQPERVKAIAWAAQQRLCGRYRTLTQQKKPVPKVIAAIARELLGFLWAIAGEIERPYLNRVP